MLNLFLKRPRIQAFLAFGLTLLLVLLSGWRPMPSQAQSAPPELRGVWLTNIDSDVLFSRSRLTQGLQQLQQLNFNTIYPTVWNWGYTLYPSPVAKRVIGQAIDPTPGLRGRDILQEMVTQGHRLGLDVIPWFEFGFMAPADSQLARRHPDWLTQRRDGSRIWQEGEHARVWLNPYKPEVQRFILDLIVEIVTRYDIDGIQFDDHFGLPFEFGYDAFTQALYRREHRGKAPPSNPQDPEWTRWRANKITAFLKQVFWAVKARKRHVLIALAPNPQEFSYKHSLADWQTWERQGFIEELLIQIYRNDFDRFREELQRPEVQAARQHIPTGIGVLTGLKQKFVPIAQWQQQVEEIRNQGFAGVSFFYYETLWNNTAESPAQRQAAFKTLFPTPRSRPQI